MQQTTHQNDIQNQIRDLARQHHVAYKPGGRDRFAQSITMLAGDDVRFDETELLLIALQRAGVLSRRQAVLMQAQYLRSTRHP